MREFDALKDYPQPQQKRVVGPNIRTLESRILASYRGEEYYDGDRNNGYGGFKYDGRWKSIARSMAEDYGLKDGCSILQLGCEKGFLLHDFKELFPKAKIRGLEISEYAAGKAMPSVKQDIVVQDSFSRLPYADGEFDLVLAIGVVYTMDLRNALGCLKEIQRVGKGKGFITLGAYRDEVGKRLFNWWTVLGTTILHVEDWVRVMKEAGYDGDYRFTTSDVLQLIEEKKTPA